VGAPTGLNAGKDSHVRKSLTGSRLPGSGYHSTGGE
jgi:hypothetical protein